MQSSDENLEEYPLAEVYQWRYPKQRGTLYLYPPKRKPAKDTLNRINFESINPEDLYYVELKKDGHPKTQTANRYGTQRKKQVQERLERRSKRRTDLVQEAEV